MVHNNGPIFSNQGFSQFCNKSRIENVDSTPFNPAINGLPEVFNKTIVKLFQNFVSSSQHNWDEELGECL